MGWEDLFNFELPDFSDIPDISIPDLSDLDLSNLVPPDFNLGDLNLDLGNVDPLMEGGGVPGLSDIDFGEGPLPGLGETSPGTDLPDLSEYGIPGLSDIDPAAIANSQPTDYVSYPGGSNQGVPSGSNWLSKALSGLGTLGKALSGAFGGGGGGKAGGSAAGGFGFGGAPPGLPSGWAQAAPGVSMGGAGGFGGLGPAALGRAEGVNAVSPGGIGYGGMPGINPAGAGRPDPISPAGAGGVGAVGGFSPERAPMQGPAWGIPEVPLGMPGAQSAGGVTAATLPGLMQTAGLDVPGVPTFGGVRESPVPGFTPMPWTSGGGGGGNAELLAALLGGGGGGGGASGLQRLLAESRG